MQLRHKIKNITLITVWLSVLTGIPGPWMKLSRAESAGEVPVLTARDVVLEALANNPDIETLEARWLQAQYKAEASDADQLPRIGMGLSSTHSTDPRRIRLATANSQPGAFSEHLLRGDIFMNWNIYSGGLLRKTFEVDNLLAQAAGKDVFFFKQRLATRAAGLYFDYEASRFLILASKQSYQSLQGQQERIQRLLVQGKAAQVDLMRVQVQTATVQQLLLRQQRERANLRANLNFLMGRPVKDDWESMSPSKNSVLPNGEPTDRATLLADTMPRADLEASQLRVEAFSADVERARAAFQPRVDLVASWGPTRDYHGREQYESGFFGITMNWHFWDGGARSARVASAQAQEHAEQSLLHSLNEQRNLEIYTAQNNLQTAIARIDVLRFSSQTATESLRVEQRKYEEGKGTITDVLSAEAASLESASLYQQALADMRRGVAELDLAVGRALSPEARCNCLRMNDAVSEQ